MSVKPAGLLLVVVIYLVVVVVEAEVVVDQTVLLMTEVELAVEGRVSSCNNKRERMWYLQIMVLMAVLVARSAVTVEVAIFVSRIVDVLATGITTMFTLRITFFTTVIFLTAVAVEVGTFLTLFVPRAVEQVEVGFNAARPSAPSARSIRRDLKANTMSKHAQINDGEWESQRQQLKQYLIFKGKSQLLLNREKEGREKSRL
jgi:hypothetical protein